MAGHFYFSQMPTPTDKRSYVRFRYSEKALELAIEEIRSGQISQNAASKKYNIPKGTLNNKIRNSVPLERRMGPPTILTHEEETKLEKWIIGKDKLGFSMHQNEVQLAVQKALKDLGCENPCDDDKPGKKVVETVFQETPGNCQKKYRNYFKGSSSCNRDIEQRKGENKN